MDIFHHCIFTVLKECQKNNLTLSKDLCKIENNIDVNFDLSINRAAFLCKFAAYNINFFKNCFLQFAANNSEIPVVLDKIISSKLVCSFSNGPGTDIIGLQLALKELGKSFDQKTSFKIISKYGSWRNTMNSFIETNNSGIEIIGNFKLLQCNVLESLSSKVENCLKSADIVIMDHAFASPFAQKRIILHALRAILQFLKPGAFLFFIDTSTKVSYLELLNSYGTYIYGPLRVQMDDVPHSENIIEEFGGKPMCSGNAYFGVWQKNNMAEEVRENSMSLINIIPAINTFENANLGLNKSELSKSTSTTLIKEKNAPRSPKINAPTVQNCKESGSSKRITELQSSSTKKYEIFPTLSNMYGRQDLSCNSTTTINNACQNANQSNNQSRIISENSVTYAEDMKVLLVSLNRLVTKLENFVSTDITSKNHKSLNCVDHLPVSHCLCDNLCLNYHHCCLHKRCPHHHCNDGPNN